MKLIFSSSPLNSGQGQEVTAAATVSPLSAASLHTTWHIYFYPVLLYVLWRLKTLRLYQLGVVGGDLDGRLLVSRCSDESDLRSSGFQTMPPTTRWHTGPLNVQKGIVGLYQNIYTEHNAPALAHLSVLLFPKPRCCVISFLYDCTVLLLYLGTRALRLELKKE